MAKKYARASKSGKPSTGSLARRLAIAAIGVKSVSAGFIDMDTPLDKRTTTSLIDGTVYHLVSLDRYSTPTPTPSLPRVTGSIV